MFSIFNAQAFKSPKSDAQRIENKTPCPLLSTCSHFNRKNSEPGTTITYNFTHTIKALGDLIKKFISFYITF